MHFKSWRPDFLSIKLCMYRFYAKNWSQIIKTVRKIQNVSKLFVLLWHFQFYSLKLYMIISKNCPIKTMNAEKKSARKFKINKTIWSKMFTLIWLQKVQFESRSEITAKIKIRNKKKVLLFSDFFFLLRVRCFFSLFKNFNLLWGAKFSSVVAEWRW